MKIIKCIWGLAVIITFSSCDSSTITQQNIKNNDSIKVKKDTLIAPISYELTYDGITILVKGRGSVNNNSKGKIKLSENEVQIFNDKDVSTYFITEFKREENKIILVTNDHHKSDLIISIYTKDNQTHFEGDSGNSIAKFNLTQGDFSKIMLYSGNKSKRDILAQFFGDEKSGGENKKTNSNINNKDSLYNWNKEYKSPKYGYTIRIPETLVKTKGIRPHIDLKFVDAFGSSITVNVSPRQKDEYSITAYDYTKDMLEQSYRQGAPNTVITYTEKLIISGEKAFLLEYENGLPNLKSMECYIYHKDFAYLITGTCEKGKFSNYRQLFKTAIVSVKLGN